MKVISFLNIKGGVGKTASVTTIAHVLNQKYNKRVLMIDLDAQGNTTNLFSNLDYYEILIKMLKKETTYIENSLSNLLADKNYDIHNCIHHTKYEGLDIIPGDLQLAEIETHLMAKKGEIQQFILKNHLKNIEDEYDYCILDCSPSINIININGLACSDYVYIPTRSDGNSLIGVMYAKDLIDTVTEYNPKLKIAGCYFEQWETNQRCPEVAYNLLEEIIEGALLPITIERSKLIGESTLFQIPLYELNPKAKVTKSFIELTNHLLNLN